MKLCSFFLQVFEQLELKFFTSMVFIGKNIIKAFDHLLTLFPSCFNGRIILFREKLICLVTSWQLERTFLFKFDKIFLHQQVETNLQQNVLSNKCEILSHLFAFMKNCEVFLLIQYQFFVLRNTCLLTKKENVEK